MPDQKLAKKTDEAAILSRLAQVHPDFCRVLGTAVLVTLHD